MARFFATEEEMDWEKYDCPECYWYYNSEDVCWCQSPYEIFPRVLPCRAFKTIPITYDI